MTTFDYDPQGRIARRFTAQGYSDYIYEDGTDWLSRETWHAVTNTITGTFDLVRYWYVNGRPSRVEIASVTPDWQSLYCNPNCYTTYYLQYNWHGDAVPEVGWDGTGGQSWGAYGAWGEYYDSGTGHYDWNAGYGYIRFAGKINFDANDALDMGLYYVHGRWYNQDTSLYLSPDANGSYIYFEDDPVNKHANPTSQCTQQTQSEPSDCEKFIQEVQRIVSISKNAGAGDDVTIMLLAQYYSGIPATWQLGPLTMASIGGVFIPGVTTQAPPFPDIQDRWLHHGLVHKPLDDPEGQKARREYGFKRIFFDNTHHYFADFYLAWFYHPGFEAWFNEGREVDQLRRGEESYFEAIADIAVGEVAADHVSRLRSLRNLPQPGYAGLGLGEYYVSPRSVIDQLPQLLFQDACGKSDSGIYAGWPRPDIEDRLRILGFP